MKPKMMGTGKETGSGKNKIASSGKSAMSIKDMMAMMEDEDNEKMMAKESIDQPMHMKGMMTEKQEMMDDPEGEMMETDEDEEMESYSPFMERGQLYSKRKMPGIMISIQDGGRMMGRMKK